MGTPLTREYETDTPTSSLSFPLSRSRRATSATLHSLMREQVMKDRRDFGRLSGSASTPHHI